ncbi:MAG: hypothetical protein Ct9H300mP20_20160 [Gammaproteobacteria bacterium]|nr:MAG: hypothetical protein Ct9H300mP20_20160 [Gammaproteobacteria bacterium]
MKETRVNDFVIFLALEVAFYDPGIIHFGLENAVIPSATLS